ncbi:MAG: 4-vinyl reductase, partial [Candidatus Aenigmatarchaeota archaeon]
MPEENFFLRLLKEGKIEFTQDGKIIGFNEHAIFLPVRVLNRLSILLKENFGEDKAKEILKELGKFQVKQAIQRYVKLLGWGHLAKERLWEFMKEVTSSLGLGRYNIKKLNENYIVITSKTPLAEEFLIEYGKQEKPIDFYLAGAFEAAFNSFLGKPMVCEEVKCYAKGDDCCEFIVKPKEETEEK